MNAKQGAEATIIAYPDRVVIQAHVLSGDVGGAASYTLLEVTPGGNVEVSRKGSDSAWADLDVPRTGTYFSEVTDAAGKGSRTQTVPVDQGFFDLAAKRGREERESKAQADAKRKQANADANVRAMAASNTAEAARAAQARRDGLFVGGILGALVVAGLVVLYLFLSR
jgi:hypothetical protein